MKPHLEVAALVAAMADRSLRPTLDVDDFSGFDRQVAQALKDSTGKQTPAQYEHNRKLVGEFLVELGVAEWNDGVPIGAAILSQLHRERLVRQAKIKLDSLKFALNYPQIAGTQQVAQTLEKLKEL